MRLILLILYLACWQRLPDIPEPKSQFGLERLGDTIYAVGGITDEGKHSCSCFAYKDGIWKQIKDVPYKMQSPVLRACNGSLYVIGGYNSKLKIKYEYTYKYESDNWIRKSDMSIAREDMGSAVIDDEIWIFGGVTNPGHRLTKTIEVYDTIYDKWKISGMLPGNRALGDFATSDNNKIYLLSGTATMQDYPKLYPDKQAIIFNTDTLNYQYFSIPSPTCYSEVELIKNKIYVVGGSINSVEDVTDSIQVYNLETKEWEYGFKMPYKARSVGVACDESNIYICGGWNGKSLPYFYSLEIK